MFSKTKTFPQCTPYMYMLIYIKGSKFVQSAVYKCSNRNWDESQSDLLVLQKTGTTNCQVAKPWNWRSFLLWRQGCSQLHSASDSRCNQNVKKTEMPAYCSFLRVLYFIDCIPYLFPFFPISCVHWVTPFFVYDNFVLYGDNKYTYNKMAKYCVLVSILSSYYTNSLSFKSPKNLVQEVSNRGCTRGAGGTAIYKLYGYVLHFRVWFSSCFSLK